MFFKFFQNRLCSADVFTGSGVDLDFVAFVDEKRNFYVCAGFNGCGFGYVGSGIAFNAGFGFGYFEGYEVGCFKTENFAFVRKDTTNVFFFAGAEARVELFIFVSFVISINTSHLPLLNFN